MARRIRSTAEPEGRCSFNLLQIPDPLAPATVEGARSVGIPVFDNPNGRMMEADGGVSITDVRVRAGKRQSAFRSYTFPYMDRPNLTVLTHALCDASGCSIICGGQGYRVEVLVSRQTSPSSALLWGDSAVARCDQHPQAVDAVRYR